jgi:hypothetical protein
MNKFTHLAAVAALMTVGVSHAESFSGSYIFQDSKVFSFTFDGTLAADNNTVTNLSNGFATLNGVSLFTPSNSQVQNTFQFTTGSATIDGSAEDFSFVDNKPAPNDFFNLHVTPDFASIHLTLAGVVVEAEAPSNVVLTRTDLVSAVPEPANVALMLAGLGFMGVVARRKASK